MFTDLLPSDSIVKMQHSPSWSAISNICILQLKEMLHNILYLMNRDILQLTLEKLLLMLLRVHGPLKIFQNAAMLWSGTTYLWSGCRKSPHTTTLTAFPYGAHSTHLRTLTLILSSVSIVACSLPFTLNTQKRPFS